jgi:hypothetical protein
MEIFVLVILYYLSQNPDFSDSVKPLMHQLKNSEQMLNFLKDLASFSEKFNLKTDDKPPEKKENPPKAEEKKEAPQSATEGIANAFIQNILDGYFSK